MRLLLFKRHFCDKIKQSNGSNYVKPITGLRKYLATKIISFVEGYEAILEKRFPSAFRVYQMFSVGTKDLYNEIVEYLRISRDLSYGRQVHTLNYNELMVYFEIPKDLMKVGPVLLIAALPFANYVVFPLAYMFPKLMLSSHFWNLSQRINFQVEDHKRRLYYYRPVFRHLQSKLSLISNNDSLQTKCGNIFNKLGSGTHPDVEEILLVKQLFIDKPYALENLSSRHLTCLCHIHGLNTFPGKRPRLWNHIGFLREMDLAINRHGFKNLSLDQMRKACFLRGLNPMTLTREEMMNWLEQWLKISQNIDSHSFSILLHSPIFLAYNHPANWRLIH